MWKLTEVLATWWMNTGKGELPLHVAESVVQECAFQAPAFSQSSAEQQYSALPLFHSSALRVHFLCVHSTSHFFILSIC
jgi:hypothetical protein